MSTKMRPFGETISLDEARAIITRSLRPIDRIERVPIEAAHGRVLAEEIVARRGRPSVFARRNGRLRLRAADTAGATPARPCVLTCIEKVFTGQMPSQTVGPGQCTEIATGAPMPPGERCSRHGRANGRRRNRGPNLRGCRCRTEHRPAGRGHQRGQVVLRTGETLNASRVGAIAALGRAHVDVYARPRVAILSTGNEIVDPGQPLQPGQIYDINRFTVAAVVGEHGGVAGDTSDRRGYDSRISSARSTNASKTMCSCSLVERPSASAI